MRFAKDTSDAEFSSETFSINLSKSPVKPDGASPIQLKM